MKTILVEDEPLSLAFLSNLLKEFFPEVTIIAREATAAGAIAAIKELQPDLVFLDIELRTGTGFEVLAQTREIPFRVIFTTALDHLAINMIRICGVHYLQKPIDMSGLKEVMQSVQMRKPEHTRTALDHLMYAVEHNNIPAHLLLEPEENGYVCIADIISLEAKDTFTLFKLRSGETARSNASLRDYEPLLEGHLFFRGHQQFLVNTREIKELLQQPETALLMRDGSRIPLSPKRTKALTLLLDNAAGLY